MKKLLMLMGIISMLHPMVSGQITSSLPLYKSAPVANLIPFCTHQGYQFYTFSATGDSIYVYNSSYSLYNQFNIPQIANVVPVEVFQLFAPNYVTTDGLLSYILIGQNSVTFVEDYYLIEQDGTILLSVSGVSITMGGTYFDSSGTEYDLNGGYITASSAGVTNIYQLPGCSPFLHGYFCQLQWQSWNCSFTT